MFNIKVLQGCVFVGNKAKLCEKLGKIEEAIDHFRKALQIRPDFKLAASNLKRVLSIRETLVAEIARLKEMLKDNPDNADLHFLLGNVYFRAEQQQQAIEAYKRSIQIDPTFVPALNQYR